MPLTHSGYEESRQLSPLLKPSKNDNSKMDAFCPVLSLVPDHDDCIQAIGKNSEEIERNSIAHFNRDILPTLGFIFETQVNKTISAIMVIINLQHQSNVELEKIVIPMILTCGSARQTKKLDYDCSEEERDISAYSAIEHLAKYFKDHFVALLMTRLNQKILENKLDQSEIISGLLESINNGEIQLELDLRVNKYLIADTLNRQAAGTHWEMAPDNDPDSPSLHRMSFLDKFCQNFYAAHFADKQFPGVPVIQQHYDDRIEALEFTTLLLFLNRKYLQKNVYIETYQHLLGQVYTAQQFDLSWKMSDSREDEFSKEINNDRSRYQFFEAAIMLTKFMSESEESEASEVTDALMQKRLCMYLQWATTEDCDHEYSNLILKSHMFAQHHCYERKGECFVFEEFTEVFLEESFVLKKYLTDSEGPSRSGRTQTTSSYSTNNINYSQQFFYPKITASNLTRRNSNVDDNGDSASTHVDESVKIGLGLVKGRGNSH